MGAYYRRNNSYSRSYNAERAESSGRYPRTRAAKELGLSVKAFDAGCKYCGYYSSEWHHVGKFANRVDYYDVAELSQNIKFWVGAKTKLNKSFCEGNIKVLINKRLMVKLNHNEIKRAVRVYIQSNFIGGENYKVQLSVDNQKNLSKALREIIRLRYKDRLNTLNSCYIDKLKNDSHLYIPKFYLNQDGSILTEGNKRRLYSEIKWEKYEPVGYIGLNGVVFKLK